MTLTYVAHTRDHVLMLDADGVCLYVHRRGAPRTDDDHAAALRCVGAQYVASLDGRQAGLLAHEPVVGAPMLFARASETGRISVLRTSPLERFELRGSGVYESSIAEPPLAAERAEASTPEVVYLPDDCLEDDDQTQRFRRQVHGGTPIRVRVLKSRAG